MFIPVYQYRLHLKVTRKPQQSRSDPIFTVSSVFTHEIKRQSVPAVPRLHPIKHGQHPVCLRYPHLARKQTLAKLFSARQSSEGSGTRRESRRVKAFLPRPPPVVSCPLCSVIISYWPGWCLTMNSISALQRSKQPPCLRHFWYDAATWWCFKCAAILYHLLFSLNAWAV